jgi:hypothetical protein
MNLGRIKKVYTLNQTFDKRILNQIQESLEGKHVDKIEIKKNVISFSNNFIGKRTNVSLMSGIDSGYFELIEKNDSNQLLVVFFFRRLLLYWSLFSLFIFIANRRNMLIATTISAFSFIVVVLTFILRYKIFVRKIIKDYR